MSEIPAALRGNPAVQYMLHAIECSNVFAKKPLTMDIKHNMVIDLAALEKKAQQDFSKHNKDGDFAAEMSILAKFCNREMQWDNVRNSYESQKTHFDGLASEKRQGEMNRENAARVERERTNRKARGRE